MKKKLLFLTALIASLLISFLVGAVFFSKDNVSNIINDRASTEYSATLDSQLYLQGWSIGENGKLISAEKNASLSIIGINGYVNNVRIDGELISYTDAFIVYIDAQPNHKIVPISIRNDDIYFNVESNVQNINIVIASEVDKEVIINSVEINPRKINFNTVNTVLSFFFSISILFSLIELYYSRETVKKDILALKRYKYLLSDLVTKDVKTKYRRSALGVLWSVLNPLLMMLVLTAVFSSIIRVNVEGGFALFYLTGYIIFNFISESTGFSLTSIINAAGLIKKVYIPKYIFPLQKTIFSFVNMLFSLSAFVLVFIFFLATGGATLKWTMLLFFVPMLYIFVFAFGLNLILSTANVFFRDVGHIWGVLLTVWMYASPIIYPITLVPDWLANIIKLNPLYYYIDYFRQLMLSGTVPSLYQNAICFFFSVSVLLLGIVFFHKKQDKFVLYI